MKKVHLGVIIAGAAVGLAALILTALGNPTNMGFCIACFLRDISGAVGLHSAAKVQYVRPEIIGLVLGAFIMSVASKEFKARAGSPPALPKSRVIKWSMPPKARTSGGSSTSKRRSDYHIMMKRDACRASLFIVSRKPLAGRVVQKRLLPMGKNKTPSVIVEMRSGNCKLQNKGRPLKSE